MGRPADPSATEAYPRPIQSQDATLCGAFRTDPASRPARRQRHGTGCRYRCLAAGYRRIEAVAVDGKVLKGAVREDGSQVHLLSAFMHGQGATIAQKEIARKTNEIPELRSLLKDVDIQDKVVTADALHTQRKTARFLVEDKKADYLFTAVKGNQRKLRNSLICLPWGDFPPQR
ncbi:ISAs1 family transposase [Acidithiobacillus ferrooxidans]|uniref:ISAs1 family transposase n=1 Tax=Acidithiobacillus ferrooxidans TaxID=920 RepID=UPI0035589C75